MLSVESAPRSNGKHVSFAIDGHGSSVENNVYTEAYSIANTMGDYIVDGDQTSAKLFEKSRIKVLQ
ncbi:Hypothetical predicted protein, partial [Paramuricea clavata]